MKKKSLVMVLSFLMGEFFINLMKNEKNYTLMVGIEDVEYIEYIKVTAFIP